MKKIYAYNEKTEQKLEYLEKVFDSDDKAAMMTIFDGDPYEMTLNDMISKYLECVFGIPKSVFTKPLVELTQGEIDVLDNISESIMTFTRN